MKHSTMTTQAHAQIQIIDVTFELAPVIPSVFCEYAFQLVPVTTAPHPIKRDMALVLMALRMFNDGGTVETVLAS